MYRIAHFLRDRLPFVWDVLDWMNAVLFCLRYGRRMRTVPDILNEYEVALPDGGRRHILPISALAPEQVASFFSFQPEEAFEYFRPHGFDVRSLRKLQRNRAFLAYAVMEDVQSGNRPASVADQSTENQGGRIVGYFFLRSFFMGKCYLGKMVDSQRRGRGIGKQMCLCAMDIASALGLRMFETISKDNLASLHSSSNVLETRIVKEMPDNYLMIEDLKKILP